MNKIKECFGIIKNVKKFDKETKAVERDLKKGWKKWSKRYDKEID